MAEQWYQIKAFKSDDDWASCIKAEQTITKTKPEDVISELHRLAGKYGDCLLEVSGYDLHRCGADFIQPIHFYFGQQTTSDEELVRLMDNYRR